MNKSRFLLSVLIGFVFVFIFEFVFHGVLLGDMYEQTADIWRTEEEMQSFFHWALLSQLVFVVALAFIFTRNYEAKGIGEGARFGLMFGAFVGVLQFGMYPYLPIPFILAVLWCVGAVLEMVGLGVVFSLLYKKR